MLGPLFGECECFNFLLGAGLCGGSGFRFFFDAGFCCGGGFCFLFGASGCGLGFDLFLSFQLPGLEELSFFFALFAFVLSLGFLRGLLSGDLGFFLIRFGRK